jgi:hypothetical protein
MMKVLFAMLLSLILSLFIFVEGKVVLADVGLQNRNTPSDLIGTWGGDNLIVEVATEGATIEYGCARGSIREKIVPDNQGKFLVKGFHKAERGGPTRQGNEEGKPASYAGTIAGNTMTFEVKLEQGNESVGTFKVEKGKRVRLMRCG